MDTHGEKSDDSHEETCWDGRFAARGKRDGLVQCRGHGGDVSTCNAYDGQPGEEHGWGASVYISCVECERTPRCTGQGASRLYSPGEAGLAEIGHLPEFEIQRTIYQFYHFTIYRFFEYHESRGGPERPYTESPWTAFEACFITCGPSGGCGTGPFSCYQIPRNRLYHHSMPSISVHNQCIFHQFAILFQSSFQTAYVPSATAQDSY